MAGENDLVKLAAELGAALKSRGLMLALAESCTGGWAAQCITAVAGSSASASFSAQSSAAPSTGSSAAAKVVQPASWTRSSRDPRLAFLSSASLAPASGAARKR